jgi:RNA polymerase sigma factor (sigma-70 family)
VNYPEPDVQLISSAQKGNREAMNTLLQPLNSPIFGFLLARLRNRSDAEDAAQETFIRIVKGLKKYEHRGQFQAWIFQIARNQAALTANRRIRVVDHETHVTPELLESYSAEVEGAPDHESLRAAIADLPESERTVVKMRLDDDLRFREIARKVGVPINTVLGRMRNATRQLRESLTTSS